MLERLKQYPLVGLSLAIAAGCVLAHLVIETGDNLYENNPDLLTDLAIAAGLLSLVVWKRRSILSWFGRHKRGLVFSGCLLLCAFFALALRAAFISR